MVKTYIRWQVKEWKYVDDVDNYNWSVLKECVRECVASITHNPRSEYYFCIKI
jgi:hypothetical protein